MQPLERKGRYYLLAFIYLIIVADLVDIGTSLLDDSLSGTELAGSGLRFLICWFLWRGSKFAHFWMMAAMIVQLVQLVGLLVAESFPLMACIVAGGIYALLFFLLFAPATDAFRTFQRVP